MKSNLFNFRHGPKEFQTQTPRPLGRGWGKALSFFLILLGLGFSSQAWAWTINNAKIYYDPTAAGWGSGDCSYIQVFFDKSDGHAGIGMTHISNTNLWYWSGSWGDGNVSYLRFATTKNNDWGWTGNQSSWDHLKNDSYCCGVDGGYGCSVDNASTLFSSTGTSKGASITKTDLSSYSALNKSQTVNQTLSTNGGTSYSTSTLSLATVTVSSYAITGNGTSGEKSGTIAVGSSSASCDAALTATVTYSVSNVSTGYTFVGWYDGSTQKSTSTTYSYTATEVKTITARFKANQYTISYQDQGGNTYSGNNLSSLPTTHTYGTATELVAGTRAGYNFDGWFEKSDCSGSAVTTIGATAKTGNFTLYAKWTSAAVYYSWAFGVHTSGGGTIASTVAAGASVLGGTSITLTASPSTGYEVEGWYSDASCTAKISAAGTNTQYTFTLNANSVVYVKYQKITYNITYTAVGTGWTYGGSNPTTGQYGDSKTFTVTPATGYNVSVTSSDASLTDNHNNTYSFSMPAKAVAISVSATEKTVTLTPTVNDANMGTVSAAGTVGIATGLELTATKKTGYKFDHWVLSGNLNIQNSKTVNDNPITVKTNGDGLAATAQAVFVADLSTGVTLRGTFNSFGDTDEFQRTSVGSNTATCTKTLDAKKTYCFKVKDNSDWYGNNGVITSSVSNWTFNTSDGNCYFNTAIGGDYVFTYDLSTHKVSIAYPAESHPSANYIYCLNSASWSVVNAHIYGGTEVEGKTGLTTWPGQTISATVTIDGTSYYYAAMGDRTTMNWANSDGTKKSADLTVSDGLSKYYKKDATGWKDFEFTLTLDKNSGSANGSARVKWMAGNTVGSKLDETPTKTGYKISKFTEDQAGNTQVMSAGGSAFQANTTYTDGNKKWNYPQSVTLYTQWTANDYVVTLDYNNGSGTTIQKNVTYDDDKNLTQITSNPLPTKTGQDFTGYWTKNDGTGTQLVDNTGYFLNEVTGYIKAGRLWGYADNLTIYAGWSNQTYSISYLDQGGVKFSGDWGSVVHPTTHTYNTATTLVDAPNKTGYTFGGWYTTSACEGEAITTLGATTYTANITLYAKWNPTTTTITLYRNDGAEPAVSTTHVATYDGAASEITELTEDIRTRTGYTHKGMFEAASGGSYIIKYDGGWKYNSTASSYASSTKWQYTGDAATFYSQWQANQYVIALNNNGGTGSASTTNTFDSKPADVAVPTKEVASVQQIFDGYYTKDGSSSGDWGYQVYTNGGKIVNNAGEGTITDASGNWKSTSITDLYAKWEAPKKVIVTFGITSGTDSVAGRGNITAKIKGTKDTYITSGVTPVSAGTVITLTYTPAKGSYINTVNGWASEGWYSNRVIAGAQKYQNAGNSYDYTVPAVNSEVFVNAPAVTNTFSVVVADGQSARGGVSPAQGTAGPSVLQTVTATPETGYKFVNWTFATDGDFEFEAGTSSTDATAQVAMKNKSNLTLTATFTPKTYKLYLATNNGTEDRQWITVTYNSSTFTEGIGKPGRTGYTFGGWQTATDGGDIVINTEGVLQANVTGWTGEGGKWIKDADEQTLYAKWTENKYTIAFDGNTNTGGSTASIENVLYTARPTLTANGFTKTGYEFAGWATTADGAVVYSDGATITSALTADNGVTVTLYAKWTAHTYKVQFVGNGNSSGEMADQNFTYGTAQNLTTNAFVKSYTITYDYQGATGGNTTASEPSTWSFNGWKGSDNNNYTDGQSVNNLTTEQGGTVTMTAQWNNGYVTLPTPTKTGFAFDGWYIGDQKIDGSQYRADANVTLTAHWTQIHVYIEGRFRVRESQGSDTWTYVNNAAGDWKTDSKNIEFDWDGSEYSLNTWATVKELSQQINTHNAYFHLAEVVGDDGSFAQYAVNTNNVEFKSSNKSAELVADGGMNIYFNDANDNSGPVVLHYNPSTKALSYTADALTYKVNFGHEGNGQIGATVGGQAISTGANVAEHSKVIFAAIPKSGYTIQGWYSDDQYTTPIQAAGTDASYTVNDVQATVNVYVKFTAAEVFFINSEKWANVKYYDTDETVAGAWPGSNMTKVGTVEISNRTFDYYKINVTAGHTIIFNNGSTGDDKKQTANLAVAGNYGKYFMADECFAAGTTPSVKPDGTWYNSLSAAQTAGISCYLDYLVTYNVNGGNGTLVAKVGDVTKESGSLVNPDVDVVFTATPTNDNFGVEGWYSDAECTKRIAGQTNNATTFTISNINKDTCVYVKFEPLYTVNLSCTNGSIKVGDATVSTVKVGQQTSVTLVATEGSDYNFEFNGWDLTNVAYEGEPTALFNKTITIKADGEHTTDLAASCGFNVLYTINTGVATGDEAKGSVKPAQKISGVGVLTHGTATAESLDSKQYSFDHWTLSINNVEKSDWTGHDTKAYGVELEEGETPEHATIHMSCTVADAKLTAHFKTRETVTIYFVNSESWSTVKLHLWGGTAEGTTWPGVTPTKIDRKVNGHDVYSYTFDKGAYTMSVWNNGGDQSVQQNKTIDITIDENNPVFNHRDNHLYPSLDAVVPDPFVNDNWKLMFNNSSVTLNIVNYDQGHTWTCDVTASTYNAESNKNWVKMQKDGAWRSIYSVNGTVLTKDQRFVLTDYSSTIEAVIAGSDNYGQIELNWLDGAPTKNFTFTFNDQSPEKLYVAYTQPSVLLWAYNADGTKATEYDVDATDALELRAYAKNATSACTYQFQYSTDNSNWVNIGSATSENIKKIHGSDLTSVPATLGKYYFKVVMSTNAQNYEATANVDLYKYYWVALKDADNWANHIHVWKSGGASTTYPGDALTEKQGNFHFYKFKYPTYEKLVWNGTGDNKCADITFNPSNLCHEKAVGSWTVNTNGECPQRIYINFVDYNYYTTLDGSITLKPSSVKYYGTDKLTYTWSIASGGENIVQLSSTNEESVSVSPLAVGTATVQLSISDNSGNESHYNCHIHVQDGITIRVMKYSDWDPVIRVWGEGDGGSNHAMNNEGNNWYSYVTTMNPVSFLIAKSTSSVGQNIYQTMNVSNVTSSGCYIVSDDKGTYGEDKDKHFINKTEDCGLYYRIESVTENGTFKSNKVKKSGDDLSFYATTTGQLNLLHYDEAAKDFVTIKTLADKPAENYVQTAKFTGNGISNIAKYTGDFYLRTNAKDGGWGTYLDDDHKFTEFTRNPRFPNEAFNYYFVEHFAINTQVTGQVANAINDNLATYIKADNFTDSEGHIASAAANVRFGYCPETNYFKRAIIADATGAGTHFMDIYGDNSTYFNGGQGNSTLYADQALTQLIYREGDDASYSQTLSDMSNWVYQTTVFATVDNMRSNDTKAIIASKFNGKWNYLLGYDEKNQCPTYAWTVLGATSTKNTVYEMTMIYDFKTNRLTSAWTPSTMTVTESIEVDAEVMFLRHENNDVAQISIAETPAGKDPITVNNLNGVVFCLEIENDKDNGGNTEKHYWISLPFDCKVSDIYGLENFYDGKNNGSWGIQRYRGDLRAKNGFWAETDTYWEWVDKDYTLKAGEGYPVSICKNELIWKEIQIGGETKSIHRIYFPSETSHLQMSRAEGDKAITTTYEDQPCTITRDNRNLKDGNWKMIGPMSYNNATTKSYTDEASHPTEYVAPNFRYRFTDAPAAKDQVYTPEPGCTTDAEHQVLYKAFYAYPVQFAGTIKWEPFTQDDQRPQDQKIAARRRTLDEEVSNATLKLEMQQGGKMIDQTFVQFNDKATTSYDLNLDLGKMVSNAYVSTICTYDNDLVKYAGNSMPADNYIIPLDVNIKTAGEYTFAMPEGTENMEVKLIDYVGKTEVDLGLGNYTINLGVADYSTRFALEIKCHKMPTNTEMIGADGQKIIKFIRDEQLYILRDGKVYNATGNVVE